MRRLWLTALALTILLPSLAVLLVVSVVGQSQADCGAGLLAPGGPVGGVPSADIPIFESAGAEFGLGARGPSILAAINDVESTFGTSTLPGVHSGANSAGAAGPMQIGIGGRAGDSWDRVKVNAPGDPPGRPPNVYDEADAIYSAAHYLRESGAPDDWPGAIFAYNHSAVYVQQVLARARLRHPRPGGERPGDRHRHVLPDGTRAPVPGTCSTARPRRTDRPGPRSADPRHRH